MRENIGDRLLVVQEKLGVRCRGIPDDSLREIDAQEGKQTSTWNSSETACLIKVVIALAALEARN